MMDLSSLLEATYVRGQEDGGPFRISHEWKQAELICNDRGLTVEPWPVGQNGNFRMAVYRGSDLLVLRTRVYAYQMVRYATYETYLDIVATIKKKNND